MEPCLETKISIFGGSDIQKSHLVRREFVGFTGAYHEPDVRIARIRLSDKNSRLPPRHVVPKPAQAYELEVPVEVREWIGPPCVAWFCA